MKLLQSPATTTINILESLSSKSLLRSNSNLHHIEIAQSSIPSTPSFSSNQDMQHMQASGTDLTAIHSSKAPVFVGKLIFAAPYAAEKVFHQLNARF